MRSLSSRLSLALLACASVAVHSSASACDREPTPRWNPERSWPGACESDVPVDGFVLLEGDALPSDVVGGEGELEVIVERTSEGVALEQFAGKLTFPDAKSALFESERRLAAHADYQITARRLSPDGRELGARFTSKFTTGELALAPITFAALPTLQLEHFDKELADCELDACGEERCEKRDETVPATYVRVAVPALEGGIEQRPYRVSASLAVAAQVGTAPVVATSDTAATQAGKRSFVIIEVPADARGSEGCVSITATDVAGHSATSDPVCLALGQTDELPTGETQASASLLSTRVDAVSAEPEDAVEQAGGCAVGARGEQASGLGWLALMLTLTRLRSRKRAH